MATAMLKERGLMRKIVTEEKKIAAAAAAAAANAATDTSAKLTSSPHPTTRKATKRKSTAKGPKTQPNTSSSTAPSAEQNNNIKRPRLSPQDTQDEMLSVYQPWVIQTYGDLAKTKTVTLKKYARILRTLRGEEMVSADNSKFRFWVKAKGFHMGAPPGYDAKPADGIVGRHSVCDLDEGIPPLNGKLLGSAKDPPLYVPNAPFKNSTGEPVYRKVAIVENFFDIIYNVHVELEGRPGKHAGQKRTYRTITETYAFLPREAVTRFLLGCTDCQKHPRSPSPSPTVPTLCSESAATVAPTSPPAPATITTATDGNPTGHNNNNNNNSVTSNNNTNGIAIGATAGHPDVVATPLPNNSDDTSPIGAPVSTMMASSPKHSPKHDVDHADAIFVKAPPSPCAQVCDDESPLAKPSDVPATTTTTRSNVKRSNNPLDVCNLTARDPPKNQRKRRWPNHAQQSVAANIVLSCVPTSGNDTIYASGNSNSSSSGSSSSRTGSCAPSPLSAVITTAPLTSPPHSVSPGVGRVTVSPLPIPAAIAAPAITATTATTTTAAAATTNIITAGQQGAVTVLASSPGVTLNVGVTTPTMNGSSRSSTPTVAPSTPKLWSPVASIEREQQQQRLLQQQQQQQQRERQNAAQQQLFYTPFVDGHHQQQYHQPQRSQYALPITTTYLKYMRSLGCSDEDAMQLDAHNVSRIIDTLVCDWMRHYFY